MLISVIVSVYNIEKYVERCIKSIVSQTYREIEIIIVIDGCIDSSEKICRKYAKDDKRIKIVAKENGGLSSARNAGLQLATGDYIFFVDGDDWLAENCVESCLPDINKGIDIVISGFVREYSNGSKPVFLFPDNCVFVGSEKDQLTRMLVGPIGEELRRPHAIENINTAWGKFYKTELIREHLFTDIKIIGTEDLWFNLPVFDKASRISYIRQGLFHYNKENVMSLTSSYNGNLFKQWKTLYKYIKEYISNHHITVDDDRALKNRIVIEQFVLSRNIVNSNLQKKEIHKELRKVLGDPIYREAYLGFDYSQMPVYWKAFYKACEWKRPKLVELIMRVAERLKKGAWV